MTQTTVRPVDGAASLPARGEPNDLSRAVVVWAAVGVLWLVVCVRALAGWITSDTDFAPAPILGPDVFPASGLVALRALEVISTFVVLGSIWFLAIKPWRETRKVRLDALLILGGLFGFVADAMLNLYDYLFAFNAHSVNMGVWSAFLPFHQPETSSRYAEALLWGLPMYVYFCAALGAVGATCVRHLRRRFPRMSLASALTVLWVGDIVFDFVVENIIIRTTEAYSFARTQSELTLWAGSQYQFPIYESLCVAFVSLAFTYARLSADNAPDGLSMIERGVLDFPVRARLPMRALAAIGYCAVVLVMLYHLPFNWLSVGGESLAGLPSYLRAG